MGYDGVIVSWVPFYSSPVRIFWIKFMLGNKEAFLFSLKNVKIDEVAITFTFIRRKAG